MGLMRSLLNMNRTVAAANAHIMAATWTVHWMPMMDAEPPSKRPPMDHRPRSIKKKLSTRPNK